MKEFTCRLGLTFSEHDLNTIVSFPKSEYPDGYKFIDLDLSDTSITRLPANLNVEGQLVLNNCPLDVLPDDLVVHDLNLQGSNVRSLSTGLRAQASATKARGSSLRLYGSKVVSIGEGLQFDNLFIDSTEMFNNKISCGACYVIPKVIIGGKPSDLSTLDFHNIEMTALYLSAQDFSYHITNARALSCLISAESDRSPCAYTISHSSFDEIKLKVNNGSSLTFTKTVEAQKLRIDSTEASNLKFRLFFQDPRIQSVILLGDLSQCPIEDFVLHGSVYIAQSVQVALPGHSIVYGNMKILNGLELPETFCCLGMISRS